MKNYIFLNYYLFIIIIRDAVYSFTPSSSSSSCCSKTRTPQQQSSLLFSKMIATTTMTPSSSSSSMTTAPKITTTAMKKQLLMLRIMKQKNSLLLLKATTTSIGNNDISNNNNNSIDWNSISKYGISIIIQMSLLYTCMKGLDLISNFIMSSLSSSSSSSLRYFRQIQMIINFIIFYSLALKSRTFNPLANFRPSPKTLEVNTNTNNNTTTSTTTAVTSINNNMISSKKRIMPSWTPPGITFPIMWLLIIGPIRAYTSSLIVQTAGSYTCYPILCLLVHLSIGDVWNTINNVERRYGTSVLGVIAVWLSKAYTIYQYYLINPFAGKLLSIALIWLSIASTLIYDTWRINRNPITNQRESLLPTISNSDIKTQFVWFTKQ